MRPAIIIHYILWLAICCALLQTCRGDEDDDEDDEEDEPKKILRPHRDPWLYCETCLAAMQEIGNVMMVTSKKERITVGGFRLDKEQEKLPMKRSEIFLSEIMDYACGAMYEYGVYTNPDSGAQHIIRASSFKGMFAPPTREHVSSGKDTTEGIVWACDIIMEHYEDEIIQFWKHRDPNEEDRLEVVFCVEHAQLCTQEDISAQMWAMAEAAMLNIKDIDNPQPEPEPEPELPPWEVEELEKQKQEEEKAKQEEADSNATKEEL